MIPEEQSLGAGKRQAVPSYVGISCVISGYAPVSRSWTRDPTLTSPVRFECPPLPTARDKHPHLFEPESEEEKSKSLVQKKIECLYGREAGEEWSKWKPNKKFSSQAVKGASVPETGSRQNGLQHSQAGLSEANGTPKKGMTKFSYPRFFALIFCSSARRV